MAHEGTERLGILGGTFDPVHVGHLVAALEVRHALALDQVLLVVAGDPWQKDGSVVAAAPDRLAMVEAALDGLDGLAASRLEIDRPGPTFTADTLLELRSPGRELFFTCGADVAGRLDTWERIDEVRRLATLVVVNREGVGAPALPSGEWRVEQVTMPRLDISSTEIRARIANGRPIEGLVPPGPVRVLRERGLYTACDA